MVAPFVVVSGVLSGVLPADAATGPVEVSEAGSISPSTTVGDRSDAAVADRSISPVDAGPVTTSTTVDDPFSGSGIRTDPFDSGPVERSPLEGSGVRGSDAYDDPAVVERVLRALGGDPDGDRRWNELDSQTKGK